MDQSEDAKPSSSPENPPPENAPDVPTGPAESDPSAEVAPVRPSRDIRCPSCARTFSDAKKFCPYCGRSRSELKRVQVDQQIMREVRRETSSGFDRIKTMSIFYAILLVSNFIVAWILSDIEALWPMFAADGVLILVSIVYGSSEKKLLHGQFTPTMPLPRYAVFPLLAVGTFVAAVIGNFIAMWLLGLNEFAESMRGLERMEELKVPLWALVISICVVPGIFEEIFFRGLVQGTLEGTMSTKEAWAAQAVIFAVAHVNPLSFFTYLVMMGLVLGWLRNKTRSLLPGILVHFTHNLLAVLSDRYEWIPF